MRSVAFVAPFPLETTLRFARAAARLPGVRLIGICQEAPRGVDRDLFAEVIPVSDGLSARQLSSAVDLIRRRHGGIHRVVGVLEPVQVQLAHVRETFGIPGTDVKTADLFRDKAKMKEQLRAHGLPVARHQLIASAEDAHRFAERVGFPMVVKPPAGMGAKSTFRVESLNELLQAAKALGAGPAKPILAEEFLVGEEGSCDSLTLGGVPKLISVSHYRPTPLTVIENPWIQWTCALPRVDGGPGYDDIKHLAATANRVLGLRDGFTHMEWFRRKDGSLAIGEIAQRPPGANITRMIGLAYDLDPYRLWARAVIDGAFDGPVARRYSVGCAYLRGQGRGRVRAVTGVERTQQMLGPLVVEAKLPTLGAPKSDSYEGDGYIIVRHEHTAVVDTALSKIIETMQVHYK